MNDKENPIMFDSIESANKDPYFTVVKLRLLHLGENRNKTIISKEAVENSKQSFFNKPIVFRLNSDSKYVKATDVEEHEENAEDLKIAGHIPETSEVEYIEDENGDIGVWIAGLLHNEYIPTLVDILEKKDWENKVSIEISFFDYETLENGVLDIKEFNLRGVCLLGEKYKEGIKGSVMKKVFSEEVNENFCKYIAYKESETYLQKEDYGKNKSIPIDKSENAMVDTPWGDVNKTELRNAVLGAKNYKTLVKSVYVKVVSDWEKNPSENLKYPVMQINDNELVYNRHALSSALAYGEKEGDDKVVSSIKKIYKKLGLEASEKKEENMSKDSKKELENKIDEDNKDIEEIKDDAESQEDDVKEEKEKKNKIEEDDKGIEGLEDDVDADKDYWREKEEYKEMKETLRKMKDKMSKKEYMDKYGLCLAEEMIEKIKDMLEDEGVDFVSFKDAICSEVLENTLKMKEEEMKASKEHTFRHYSMPLEVQKEVGFETSDVKSLANKYRKGDK